MQKNLLSRWEIFLATNPINLSKSLFVYPNLTSHDHFQNFLASQNTLPLNSTDIETFSLKISGFGIMDNMDIANQMFTLHKEYYKEDNYEQAYPWIKLILSDYYEMDKQLTPKDLFFSELTDIKEIESINDETLEELKFFSSIKKENVTGAAFLSHWDAFKNMYWGITNYFEQNKAGYSTYAFRKAVEKLQQEDIIIKETINKTFANEFESVAFVGFTRVSVSEEAMFNLLKRDLKVYSFFPINNQLIKGDTNKYLGATTYQKNLMYRLANKEKEFDSTHPNIYLYPTDNNYKQLERLTSELLKNNPEPNDTVITYNNDVILPFLTQKLNSLGIGFNLPLGLPFRFTQVYSFIVDLQSLIKSYQSDIKGFPYKEVLSFLQSLKGLQLYSSYLIENEISNAIKQGLVFFPLHTIFEDIESGLSTHIKNLIYEPNVSSNIQLFDYLEEKSSTNVQKKYFDIIKEFILSLSKGSTPNLDTYFILYLVVTQLKESKFDIIENEKQGIILLPFYDTTGLYFKHIYMLDMSADNIPKPAHKPSYIPNALKRRYKMQTAEGEVSHISFQFYSLIAGAESVHLFYTQNIQTGKEPSPLIYQLNDFYKKYIDTDISITEITDTEVQISSTFYSIEYKKDNNFFDSLIKKAESGFSFSYLSDFMQCSLMFYLKHIKGLSAQDELSEIIEANTIGTVLHNTIEQFYKPVEDKKEQITPDWLQKNKERLTILAQEEIKRNTSIGVLNANILIEPIINTYLDIIFENDLAKAEQNPFFIVKVEHKFNLPTNIKTKDKTIPINFKGTIDRIEEDAYNTLSLIDYKTGKVNKFEYDFAKKSLFEDDVFSEHKEIIQLLLYQWAYEETERENVQKLQILAFRADKGESDETKFYRTVKVEYIKNKYDIQSFFNQLIGNLFDTDIPIQQVKLGSKVCNFCDFKNLCNR